MRNPILEIAFVIRIRKV